MTLRSSGAFVVSMGNVGHSACIEVGGMTLRQLCAARGLTLEQVAERAGIAVATVVKIDAGTIRAQPSTRARLAAVLGIDPKFLRDELSDTRRGRESSPLFSTEWR